MIYALTGMVLFAVLGLWSIDRARQPRTPKALPTAAMPTRFVWLRCPDGHCKVLASSGRACPVCNAGLVPEDALRGLLIEQATGRFIGVL
jgi:hypothetical protein